VTPFIKNCVKWVTLAEMLGHSNLATTQIYTNLSPEMALEEFTRKW